MKKFSFSDKNDTVIVLKFYIIYEYTKIILYYTYFITFLPNFLDLIIFFYILKVNNLLNKHFFYIMFSLIFKF